MSCSAALTLFQMFHFGGDEVPSGTWQKSPVCERLKMSGVATDLTTYMVSQIANMTPLYEFLDLAAWEDGIRIEGKPMKRENFPNKLIFLLIKKKYQEEDKIPEFIFDGVNQHDVYQGDIGNCWFIAGASALALSHPAEFQRVVPPDQSFDPQTYTGMFRFNFWWFGTWTQVIVDDYLPTHHGKLIYCHNVGKPNEFWPCLLEKAYAKLYGSYQVLVSGFIHDALVDLTGGISEEINIQDRSHGSISSDLYNLLYTAYKMGTLMGAMMIKQDNSKQYEERRPDELYRGHGYSITGFRTEVDDVGQTQYCHGWWVGRRRMLVKHNTATAGGLGGGGCWSNTILPRLVGWEEGMLVKHNTVTAGYNWKRYKLPSSSEIHGVKQSGQEHGVIEGGWFFKQNTATAGGLGGDGCLSNKILPQLVGREEMDVFKQNTATAGGLGEMDVCQTKYCHSWWVGRRWMFVKKNTVTAGGLGGRWFSNKILTQLVGWGRWMFVKQKNTATAGGLGGDGCLSNKILPQLVVWEEMDVCQTKYCHSWWVGRRWIFVKQNTATAGGLGG
ncbi:Cleavage polyadenylation factor subunit clp1 [Bulinus truncatus]|nr:Cleavage polyadenylation factor subunit clp1 [Bulinus truncatus]